MICCQALVQGVGPGTQTSSCSPEKCLYLYGNALKSTRNMLESMYVSTCVTANPLCRKTRMGKHNHASDFVARVWYGHCTAKHQSLSVLHGLLRVMQKRPRQCHRRTFFFPIHPARQKFPVAPALATPQRIRISARLAKSASIAP